MKTSNQINPGIESLKAQLSEAFADSFMQPYVQHCKYARVKNTYDETTILPADVVGDSTNPDDYADYIEGEPQSVEILEGFLYRLSAPGYMDCTEWAVAETLEEALQELLNMAGD